MTVLFLLSLIGGILFLCHDVLVSHCLSHVLDDIQLGPVPALVFCHAGQERKNQLLYPATLAMAVYDGQGFPPVLASIQPVLQDIYQIVAFVIVDRLREAHLHMVAIASQGPGQLVIEDRLVLLELDSIQVCIHALHAVAHLEFLLDMIDFILPRLSKQAAADVVGDIPDFLNDFHFIFVLLD